MFYSMGSYVHSHTLHIHTRGCENISYYLLLHATFVCTFPHPTHIHEKVWDDLILCSVWDRIYILTPYTHTQQGVGQSHIIFYCMGSYIQSHTLYILTRGCETFSYDILWHGIVSTFLHPTYIHSYTLHMYILTPYIICTFLHPTYIHEKVWDNLI